MVSPSLTEARETGSFLNGFAFCFHEWRFSPRRLGWSAASFTSCVPGPGFARCNFILRVPTSHGVFTLGDSIWHIYHDSASPYQGANQVWSIQTNKGRAHTGKGSKVLITDKPIVLPQKQLPAPDF